MIKRKWQALFHSEQYHGWGKKKRYFEGWYYKLISSDEENAIAIIPGIAMDNEGNQQAFIQILDGRNHKAEYHKFPAKEFKPSSGEFELKLGSNFFNMQSIQLDLEATSGDLQFIDQRPWPSSWYSPGIMGPFSFVPFMECYHGILSMNHRIKGSLILNGKRIDFTEGYGYMEKDWGRSFPSGYIWMQSNHFSRPNISLKASVAKIPWMGTSFVGFIAGVMIDDRLIQFTTYNLTRLKKCKVGQEVVEIILENGRHKLIIEAHRSKATELASPILGFMDGRIEESMTSEIKALLTDKKTGEVLLDDLGRNAGMEVAGKVEALETR